MRKQFFSMVDSVLPRQVALIPYQTGLLLLKLIFQFGLGIHVWNRNSTRNGSFIFGISDLDITLVYDGRVSVEFIHSALKTLKKIVPFLGEVNLYQANHLSVILSKMNSFELMRDPELISKYKQHKRPSLGERFVFIQRMLFSDAHSLNADPLYRQLKWQNHLKLINFEFKGELIDFYSMITVLKELSQNTPRLCESIQNWSEKVFENNFDVYRTNLGEGFGIFAPHCKLWFQSFEDVSYLKSLTKIELEIFLAQIDWEICGIYSQKYHLPRSQFQYHLEMLLKVQAIASIDEKENQLRSELTLLF
jgi:hypothetical protein